MSSAKPPADLFAEQVRAHAIPAPEAEFAFAETEGRRWRFDFAWPADFVAVEIEGGSWVRGGSRHTNPAGFAADCEKYNRATLAGWRVLRVTADQVSNGRAIAWLMEALGAWEITGHEKAGGTT